MAVDSNSPERGLEAAGWNLVNGETYCPTCASARGLASPSRLPPRRSADSPRAADFATPPADEAFGGKGQGIATPAGGPGATSPAIESSPSREMDVLNGLQARARRFIAFGCIAAFACLPLFTELSSNPVAVSFAGLAMVACPVALFWDDRAQRPARFAIAAVLFIFGFSLVLRPLVYGWRVEQIGEIVRWVALVAGLIYIWVGKRWLSLISAARESLRASTYDVRLETKILKGYGAAVPTMAAARLWPADRTMLPQQGEIAAPLAQFRQSQQLSEPQLVNLSAVPAKVYGQPLKGAIVVVSSPEAVVLGRIKWSHFGEPISPPRPMSPLVAWLWKPRHVRVP